MRKVFLMLGLLLGFVGLRAADAPLTQPDAAKEYYVVHSSGLLLSHEGSGLKLMKAGNSTQQTWKFESANASSYYMKDIAGGKYLGSDNGYTPNFADTPAAMPKGEEYAMWEINVSYLADQIVLKNVGRGAHLGSDSNADGAGVYTDKNGKDGKHLWRIIEKTGSVYTLGIDAKIAAAEALIAEIGTNVGSAHGQYAKAAVDALNAAIAAAKAAKNGTDQKAVNDAEDALAAAIEACQSARIIIIDTTKKYAFKQKASGFVLGLNASNIAVLQAQANTNSQIYQLEAVDGEAQTFNFKNKDGKYIGKANNNYHIAPFDAAGDVTKYDVVLNKIDSVGTSWYNLRNVSRNGYMASNYAGEGEEIYTDKSLDYGDLALWTLVEIDESIVVTAGLETAIASAQAALEGITIGTAANCFTQQSVDALNAAIATAQAALEAKASQDAVNAAADALNAATATFLSSRIVFLSDPNKQYYLMQEATNLVVTMTNNEAKIDNPNGGDSQKFRLIAAEEGSTAIYNLQLANGTDYLIRRGGWNTTVGTDPTQDVAKWRFIISDLEKGLYALQKFEETRDNLFATDGVTPGSTVYTNKGISSKGRWRIIEVVPGQALTQALDMAKADAQALIDGAVVGTEPGQYPQAAVDALKAALAAANAADLSTQESVNAAAVALQQAIADFKAAVILPWFKAEAGVKYRFSINKYEKNYLTNVDGSAKATVEYTAGNAGQHWTMEEVDKVNHVFVVKNGELALNYDGTVTAPASEADAPKWRTVYTNTRNNIEYFALVQDADPTKVLTFASGKTLTIQTLSTGNNAHQGRFMRVDPVNDSNLGALEIAIATAQVALNGVDRGPAIGQYSDAKCNAFQARIDLAKTFYSGKTQEEVDAEVKALDDARKAFLANPNSVIRDSLDSALVKLDSIAQNAVIGIEVGEFMWSQIDSLKAKHAAFVAEASKISEQAPCDSLTAVVIDYINTKGKGHATKQEVNPVLDDAIACADAIYQAEKDNVGTDMGQRTQEVVDAFRDAIAAAKAVQAPVLADLKALLDAYDAFMNGAVSVDRTALRKAIADAEDEKYSNLVAGEFDGMYPQVKIDDFTHALDTAKTVEADMSKLQAEVDAATTKLNSARTALDASQIKIQFAALDTAIVKAERVVATVTEIGEGDGKCPQAAVDSINTVITKAKAIDRAAINQVNVDTITVQLDSAVVVFKAAVRESSGLDSVIVEASDLLEGVEAGFKPGNYPANAIAALESAIATAQEAATAQDFSQANLIAAAKALKDAIAKFKEAVIPANDLTELNAAIALAEYAIADGLDDAVVNISLAAAKEAAANPNDYSQKEINTLAEDLKLALSYAGYTSISSISAADASISISADGIVIAGLEGTVVAYTADGRVAAQAQAQGHAVKLSLAPGFYIIAVDAQGAHTATAVQVK